MPPRTVLAVDEQPAPAQAWAQRAATLHRLARDQQALAAYGAALATFRRSGDRLWQARALTDRGALQVYRGALRAAERDLRRAERLYDDLGEQGSAAQVRHDLGLIAAQAGDVPA